MARAATTTDAFNAVAEPRRRQILDVLAAGELPVNDIVAAVGLAQPQVSTSPTSRSTCGCCGKWGSGRCATRAGSACTG
jgi:predicted transcriptional regulator